MIRKEIMIKCVNCAREMLSGLSTPFENQPYCSECYGNLQETLNILFQEREADNRATDVSCEYEDQT